MGLSEINARMQYEKDPKLQEKFGSFEKYFEYKALELKKESILTYGKNVSDSIKNSVKGWALEQEAKKDEAEQRYYAALQQYSLMKSGEDKALSNLRTVYSNYGENSTQFNDAMKSYKNSTNTLFDANIELSCARDHFNSANKNAFMSYLTTRNLQG